MDYGLSIPEKGALDFVSLGALVHRLDPGKVPFRKATELAPERSWGPCGLAQLYLHGNRKLREAKSLAAAAVELEPVASNYAVLSEACDKNGDLAGAVAAMQRAVELEPDNTRYQRIYELLQNRK